MHELTKKLTCPSPWRLTYGADLVKLFQTYQVSTEEGQRDSPEASVSSWVVQPGETAELETPVWPQSRQA